MAGYDRNIVGCQIRLLRKAKGLTQADLAARCGVLGFDIVRETISQIERGVRRVTDLELVLLAKALRVAMVRLIPQELPPWEKDLRPPGAEL